MKPLRGFLYAALLGLPTALAAHALVFGGEHSVGGAFQSSVLAGGLLGLLLVLALHSKQLVQGSIAAHRLRGCIPGFLPLAVSASAWFAALEACESAHALPVIAIVAALFAACAIVRLAVKSAARCVAAITFALLVSSTRLRIAPDSAARFRFAAPQPVRLLAHSERLFSRPPPALS